MKKDIAIAAQRMNSQHLNHQGTLASFSHFYKNVDASAAASVYKPKRDT